MRNARLVIGSICAVCAGIAYVGFLWGTIWESFDFVQTMSLAAGAIGVIVALTLFFRPEPPWLFPLCFAAPTFLITIAAVGWVVLGVATFAVAFLGTYVARYVSSKLRRT